MRVVVLGSLPERLWQGVDNIVPGASVEHAACESAQDAWEELAARKIGVPRCVFLDVRLKGAASFLASLRGDVRLFAVPVVCMVPTPTDESYASAYAAGADEVLIVSDKNGVAQRLSRLSEYRPPEQFPMAQHTVAIAHPDAGRRRILGQMLRQGGYEPAYAASRSDLVPMLKKLDSVDLLVTSTSICKKGAEDIAKIRASLGREDLPVILLSGEKEKVSFQRNLKGDPIAMVTDERSPADQILFVANELRSPNREEIRASKRLLFATLCAFRSPGGRRNTYGLTYNVSREGLYVRTLDPPQMTEELWFEMKLQGQTPVHLRGQVVWVRQLSDGVAAVPPGFGIHMDREACPPKDLSAYQTVYDALLRRQ